MQHPCCWMGSYMRSDRRESSMFSIERPAESSGSTTWTRSSTCRATGVLRRVRWPMAITSSCRWAVPVKRLWPSIERVERWRGRIKTSGLAPASPILIDVDGQEQLVVFAPSEVVGLDPNNGDLLWSHPHETQYGLNISTPVWGDGNLLFTSSAYDGGSRVIRLSRDGGKTTAEELWYDNRLRLHFGNAIRIGNLVFGTSGDFGPAFFIAVDVVTGKEKWRERTFGRSQMVYADGMLVIVDEDGDLALATVAAERLNVLARAEILTENAWTPPTLVGTKLYVRDRKNIVALELGE